MLFHPDAIVIDSPIGSLDEQPDLFAYHEVLDWRWVVRDCFQTPRGAGSEITCSYLSENAWSRMLGEGLIDGQIRFAITDGKISEMYHDYNVPEWDQRIVNPFRAWLQTNRPDLDDELWTSEGFLRPADADRGLDERVVPQLTDEALAQCAALTAEFAAATR